jgi:ribosomal protein L27
MNSFLDQFRLNRSLVILIASSKLYTQKALLFACFLVVTFSASAQDETLTFSGADQASLTTYIEGSYTITASGGTISIVNNELVRNQHPTISIKLTSGGDFTFASMDFIGLAFDETTLFVQAKQDGVNVGTALSTQSSTTTLNGTSDFIGIDELVITANSSDFTEMDNINLDAVVNSNATPTFTSTPVTSVNNNANYSYAITTSDPEGDQVKVTGTELPSWLTLTVSAESISTFVGTGTSGTTEGTGTAASLTFSEAMVMDSNGNLYVSGQHMIRKITPEGVTSIMAGSGTIGSNDGTGSSATFNYPRGLAIDASGNIYVADQENHRIRKIATNGVVSTVAGTGGYGNLDGTGTNASIGQPGPLAIDSEGNVYIGSNNRIRKLAPNGVVTTFAGGTNGYETGTGTDAQFSSIASIIVDDSNNLYVTTASDVRKVTPTAVVTIVAGSGGGYAEGNGTNAQFNQPKGLAIDDSGILYVTEAGNRRIRKITPNGDVTTFIGTGDFAYVDGSASIAKFKRPIDILIDDSNNFIVLDQTSYAIRKIKPKFTLEGNAFGLLTDQSVELIAIDSRGESIAQSFTISVNDVLPSEIQSVTLANTNNSIDVTFNEGVYGTNAGSGALDINDITLVLTGGTATSAEITSVKTTSDGALAGGESIIRVNFSYTGIADGTETITLTVAADAVFDASGNAASTTQTNNTATLADDADPIFTSATTASFPENQTYSPYTVVATDARTLTYSFGGTPDDQFFDLDASSGILSFKTPPDFENPTDSNTDNDYVIAVNASDGVNTVQQVVTISVTGLTDEVFPVITSGATASFVENAIGTIYTVTATDDNGITYHLGAGNDGTYFNIDENTGEVSFKASPNFEAPLDADANNDYIVNVAAFDGSNIVFKTVTISVTNTAESPVFTSSPITAVSSNSDYVYSIYTSDPEGDNVTIAGTTLPSWLSVKNEVSNVVTTLAGSTGNNGTADGVGTDARFQGATDLAVDNDENVYVIDRYRIRKITKEGVVTTLAGSKSSQGTTEGTGTDARFQYPKGIAVDASGNVYVSDQNRIRKITPNGVTSTFVGGPNSGEADGNGTAATLYDPYGLAFDTNGILWVVQTYSNILRKVTSAGDVTSFTINNHYTNETHGIALDAAGNIYLAGYYDYTNFKVTPDGTVTDIGSNGSTVESVAVDAAGNVYFTDDNRYLSVIAPGGTKSKFVGSGTVLEGGTGTNADVGLVSHVAIDKKGNLYMTDSYGSIRKTIAQGPQLVGNSTGQTGSHAVVLSASDGNGGTATQSFNVSIDGIAPVFTSLTTASFVENATGSAYTVIATDDYTITYTLGSDNDEGLFNITAGVVTFKTAPDFENPTDGNNDNAYIINVIATDEASNTSNQNVTITVTDIDDSDPVINSLTTATFAENGTGTAYTIAAIDANAITYSLGTGNDEALFDITAGAVTFKNAPDFETPGGNNTDNTYVINVIASDGVNSANQNVTITVTDVTESAVITSFSPLTGNVGATVTIIGTDFNATPANNIVFFGATKATVSAATTTSLTVTVPTGATYAPITVLNTGTNLAAYSFRKFNPTYSPAKTGITTADFSAKQDFTTGTSPYSVAIGDLDGDGKPDLAVVNTSTNTVSVFLNTSTNGSVSSGSFATTVNLTTGTSPLSVAIGDLDGDGKPDLAVANSSGSPGSISLFHNTSTSGSISFANKVDFSTGFGPQSVAIGDIDGDGKLDLVIANSNSNAVSVFRNTSTSGSIVSGSFANKVDFTTGSNPNSVVIGDLDGDGKLDLAVTNNNSASVSVFRNTSTIGSINAGSLATRQDFNAIAGAYPTSVAMGDIDGDGKLDLAVTNSSYVSVFRNTATSGSINFATKVDFVTGTNAWSVAFGDVDGDGKTDLAVANRDPNTITLLRNTASSGTISAGSFATKVDFTTATSPRSVAIGDLDGDGKPEMVAANFNTDNISILQNVSTNADLSAMTISAGTLSPVFASGTTSYAASVSNATSSITVTPTRSDANATIKVNGTTVNSGAASGSIALSVGSNTITTIVTAQNGSTKTYTVTVTRLSSNADLSAMTISAGTLSPTFASGTTTYTASVSNATSSITVTPTRSDANATITVNGTGVTSGSASGSIALSVGSNTITTIVTAQDASTKTYTLTVTRNEVQDKTVTALVATVCEGTSTFINVASSQVGVNYTLRNNSNNAIVAGPTPGTGSTLALSTGAITTATTFNVYAEKPGTSGALNFDGTAASAVRVLSPTITPSQFTVSTWVKLNALQKARIMFATFKDNPTHQSGIGVGISDDNDNVIKFFTSGNSAGTAHNLTSNTALNNNQWYNITFTYDGSTKKLYIDGTLDVSAAYTGAIGYTGNNVTLGGLDYQGSLVQNLNGSLDETRVYDYALTQAQIQNTISTSLVGNESGLLAYYTYENGTGSSTLTDVTSNGNTGTLTNMNANTAWVSSAVGGIAFNSQMTNTPIVTVTPAPVITSFSPTSAATGTTVTLTGTDFTGATGVSFGGTAATSFTVVSSTSITAVLANGTSGSASVTTACGTGTKTGFTYLSSNADLSALSTTAGALSPAFASGTTAYTTAILSNATTSVTVTPTQSEANATIEVQVNGGGFAAVTTATASDALALNVGSNTVDVKVTAEDGSTVKTYTTTIIRNTLPVFTSATTANFAENGTGTAYTITATDANAIAYSLGTGNDEALFNITADGPNGIITFKNAPDFEIPTDGNTDNTYVINVIADDGTNSVNQDVTITVTNVNDNAPVFTSTPVTSINEGETYTYSYEATDADLDVLTFSAPTLPSWLTFTQGSASETVTTLAGGGSTPNADGTGNEAAFLNITAMTSDGDGNVYVANGDNSTIRKMTPSGVVTTLATNVSNVVALAANANGDVFAAESTKIRKVTQAGSVTDFVTSGIVSLTDMVIDPSGTIYWTALNSGNGRLAKANSSGQVTNIYTKSISPPPPPLPTAPQWFSTCPTTSGPGSPQPPGTVYVVSVNSPTPFGSMEVGDVIEIRVNFSAVVNVTGTPQLTLETGATDRVVDYSGIGSGTNSLIFNYTVQSGDEFRDLDYVSTNSLSLGNDGTIKSAANNSNAVITLPGLCSGSLASTSEFSIGYATVVDVSSPTPDGEKGVGDMIEITVTFSKAVNVVGIPKLILETGATDRSIFYNGTGSGTTTLSFDYTVQAGDNSADLNYTNFYALSLQGGSIKDLEGNNAIMILPYSGTKGSSLSANKNLVIDALLEYNIPSALAIDGDNNLYVVVDNSDVVKFSAGATTFSSFAKSNLNLDKIAFGNDDKLYAFDNTAHNLQQFDNSGNETVFAGSGSSSRLDGVGTAASFTEVKGISIDPNGILYAAESDYIRKIGGIDSGLTGTAPSSVGTHSVVLRADDSNGQTSDQSFTITVYDVTDPLFTSHTEVDFIENGAGIAYTATANETVTFTLGNTKDEALFSLANDNEISFTNAPDFETPLDGTEGVDRDNAYVIDVIATDPAGNITTQTVTITVTDIDEIAPNFTSAATANYEENGTGIAYTIAANDANALTYTIGTGNDEALFDINSTSGIITFKVAPDFENPSDANTDNTYVINVIADDGTNSVNQDVTITVTNVSDVNPIFTSTAVTAVNDNATYSYTITTSDADGDALTVTAITKPTWLTFSYDLNVNTLSGSGVLGLVNGAGISAQFNRPRGLAVDAVGNVYVADTYNNSIRKITSEGVVSTLAGSTTAGAADGTGSAAQFKNPDGLVLDDAGNIYVADASNNSIRKITPEGVVTTFAGATTSGTTNGIGSAARFNYPTGITIDAAGNFYVVDAGNHSIRKITSGGVVSTLAGGSGPTAIGFVNATGSSARFFSPYGIVADASGNVYVSETNNQTIRKISPTGVVTNFAGATASFQSGNIDGTGGAARFSSPQHLAIDASGNIYVVESGNHKIRKITPAGVVTSLTGSTQGFQDGIISSAQFSGPYGIAINGLGEIFVSEFWNNRIRKIKPEPILTGSSVGQSGNHAVTLTASDGVNTNATQTFNINVVDVTNPVFTSVTTANFAENGTGTAYTITATDANAITYSLGTGNDEALFNLTAGVVTFKTSPDFEIPSGNNADNTYVINVIASDGVNSANQNVTITVTDVDDTDPVFTSATTANFAENGTGTAYTITATDANAIAYSLGTGNDEALFNITADGPNGLVTFKNAPDFENPTDGGTNNTYIVNVIADDGTNSVNQDVTITVTDVAEDVTSPTFESALTASNVQDLYFAINLDLDESGTVYYVVLADGANAPTSAEVKAGTSSGGSIAILSGNKVLSESPSFSGIADIAVLTSSTSYDVYVVAEDVNTNLQTTPSKVDATTDAISTNFRWTSATRPSAGTVAETVNGVMATLTSSGSNADFGPAGNQFGTTFNLGSVNAPVANMTVSFNSAVNLTSIRVVNFSTKDWVLTPTGGNNAVVNSAAPSSPGSEVVSLNWIGVTGFTVTESLGASVAFIIDDIVVNPNSAPVVDLDGATAGSIDENGSIGIADYATITDADNDNIVSMTITLTGYAGAKTDHYLGINGATNTIATNAGVTVPAYDSNNGVLAITGSATAATYTSILRGIAYINDSENPPLGDVTINIEVNDGTVKSDNVTNVITITPVNDDPVFTSLTTANFAENGTGTAYTITATDVDSNNLTYSLSTGNDETLFNITAGAVTFKNAPDFESASDGNTDNAYVINVIASDGENEVNQDVTITVTNVDDTDPVFTSLTTATFAENGTGTAYTIAANDANAITYSLGTGNDEGFFDIASGVVTFKVSPDFETKATYTIQVKANDGLNEATQNVTITITDVDEINPVFTSATTANFAENGTGTAYTITATDANSITYSLGTGNDESLFDITAGVVTFKTSPDFEVPTDGNTDNAYMINVIATDASNNSVNQDVTITVTDGDEIDPVFTSVTAVNFAENGTGTAYTITATDDNDVTYTIATTKDYGKFNVVNGVVTFATAPDFETPTDSDNNNTYEIDVIATDGLNEASQTVTITVTDGDEIDPVFTSVTAVNFAENGTGTAYTITATDDNDVTYTIATTKDYGKFNVVNGVVTFATAPDFETPTDSDNNNTYEIDVIATDGLNEASQTVTITVTDVDEIDPVFTSATAANFAENGTGTAYTITATDDNDVTYTIATTKDYGKFNVVNGVVTFATAPDFETPTDSDNNNTYEIDVIATDGLNEATQTVTITVTDVDEIGPVFTSLTTANFAENGIGTAYTITATDANDVTYTIATTKDYGKFNVVNGVVTFASAPDFETPTDSDNNNSYVIDVIATDGLNEATQTVTITVTDVDEIDPVFTSLTTANFAENGTGSAYTITATDDNDVTYTIATTKDYGKFNVVNGVVTFATAPDFETPTDSDNNNSYVIDVIATDGLNEATQTVTITVTDVDEIDPVFTSLTTANFAENGTGTAYTITATDDNDVTYTIATTKDYGKFNVVNGVVTFATAPDFETPTDSDNNNSYVIDVIATDGLNEATQTVTITVTDVDEIDPVFTSLTTANFAENGTGTAYTITATDDNDVTYTIATTKDYGKFNVVNGVVTFATAPDFETPTDSDNNNTYEIDVIATDGLNEATQTVTITITDVDEIDPVFTSATAVNFAENGTGTAYTITATDANAITYSLGTGNDESLFDITAGVVTFKTSLDFEIPTDGNTDNAYVVNVIASDGINSVNQNVTISVTNVNDAPIVSGDVLDLSFTEGVSGVTLFTNVNVSTVESGQVITGFMITLANTTQNSRADERIKIDNTAIALVNGGSGLTSVNAFNYSVSISDGIVSLRFTGGAASAGNLAVILNNLEYQNRSQNPDVGNRIFTLREVTDSGPNGGFDSNVAILDHLVSTIDIIPVDNASVITSSATANFAENGAGTAYTITATDVDAAQLTYGLGSGNDEALFNVNANTGAVTFKVQPNFELPTDGNTDNAYVIVVKAIDGVHEVSKTVTITVTDVYEDPAKLNLVSSTPLDGAINFTGTTITLVFDRAPIKGAGTISVKDASNDTDLFSKGVNHPDVIISGNTVVIDMRSPLPLGKEVYLSIPATAFKDASNVFFSGISDKTALNFFTPQTPQLVSSTPADDAIDVSAASITLTFDRPLTAALGEVSIKDASNNSEVWKVGVTHPSVIFNGNTVTIDIGNILAMNKQYYLNLTPTALKDADNLYYKGITDNTTLNFTTAGNPKLLSSTPADDATGFGGTTVSLTFDKDMVKGTGLVSIKDASNDTDIWSVGIGHPSVSINGSTVTFNVGVLPLDKAFYVQIAPTALKDGSNLFYGGISDQTTLNFFGKTSPLLIASTPADDATNYNGTTVTLTFDRAVLKGAGVLTVFDAANDAQVWSVGINHPSVSINGATVTLNVGVLPVDKQFYLNVAATAFKDAQNNFYKGITNKTTLNFSGMTAPVLVASTPSDNATGYGGTTVTLTFDRNLVKGTGLISLKNAANDADIWSVGVYHPDVVINGSTVTLNVGQLPIDTDFYINIGDKVFKDVNSVFYAGIADKTTLNFSGIGKPKLISSNPTDGSIGFTGSNIVLTFDRNVIKGAGVLTLFDAADDSPLWSKGINNGAININGSVVTLNVGLLPQNKDVYLNIGATAFKDASDLFYAGITDKTTLNFSTPNSGGGSPAPFDLGEDVIVMNAKAFSIYPNPATNEVTINLSEVGEAPTVIITNLSGMEMFRNAKVETEQLTIDVSSYSQGVFLITVISDSGEVIRKKMSVIR